MNPMSVRTPTVSWKSGDGVPDQFPVGLRVLVVDDDPTCLFILENMLKKCQYEVTKCNRAEGALKLLRENRDGYDVVISDVHMPDMDGFKLLEHVGLEMDLPVIMMSADDSKSVVMKGVTHGACDYLIKPVSMEALKNIWQHVVRKRKPFHEKDSNERGSVEDGPKTSDDYSSANWKSCKKRKDDEGDDTSAASKKPRVVWSVELHQQFVTAVNQLGIDKAVPKKILELMNVPGLTRENVASHLQKYRLYLKRVSVGQQQQQNMYGNPFMNGLDFGSSSQLLPAAQSLAAIQAGVTNRPDHRNTLFSFENQRNNNQVNVNFRRHPMMGNDIAADNINTNAAAAAAFSLANSNPNPNHGGGGLFNNLRNVEWGRVDVGFLSDQRSSVNNILIKGNVGGQQQQQLVSSVKPERLSDMGVGFQTSNSNSNSPFLDHFPHDDLYNAFLRQTEEELIPGDFRGLDVGSYQLDNLPV